MITPPFSRYYKLIMLLLRTTLLQAQPPVTCDGPRLKLLPADLMPKPTILMGEEWMPSTAEKLAYDCDNMLVI